MIFTRCVLTLLGLATFQSIVGANILDAADMQTCIDLCTTCEGTATFEENICQCHVAEDNQQGAECISRIKRQAQNHGMDIVSCDLADDETDRAARCILSSSRRFKTGNDAGLIAKYFMDNTLGGFGSLLGKSQSQKEETKSENTAENDGTSAKTNGNDASANGENSDSTIVGAENPSTGPITGTYPLYQAGLTWLQPQNLIPLAQGFQRLGGNSRLIGQQTSNLMSESRYNADTDSNQMNYVGSPHQDMIVGDSARAYDMYTLHSVGGGEMPSMTPYSYFVGAPNPVQFQNAFQIPSSQSYLYNYNSMVETQDPLVGSHYQSPYPYSYCQMPLVQANNPQVEDIRNAPDSSLNENVKEAKEFDSESDADTNLGVSQDSNLKNKAGILGMGKKENGKAVGKKKTSEDKKTDAGAPEEVKDRNVKVGGKKR